MSPYDVASAIAGVFGWTVRAVGQLGRVADQIALADTAAVASFNAASSAQFCALP